MPRKRKAPSSTADPPAEASGTRTRSSKGAKHEVQNNNNNSKSKSKQTNHFKRYPASKVYRLIEPGPVLLVSTGSLTSQTHNIMTIGFHGMLQHDTPALIGVSIGPWDASYASLSENGECVLAVPDVSIIDKVVDIGNCSADEVDKWSVFEMEALPAEKVDAPLIGGKGVSANVECVVVDRDMVETYQFWVLKVVRAWLNPELEGKGKMFHHRGDGTFVVDGEVLDLRERMVKWKQFQD